MNETLRKVLIAGLGSAALTSKAVRTLIDDLVSKQSVTRGEGERLLAEFEQKWGPQTQRLEERLGKGREQIGKQVEHAVNSALKGLGLVRRDDVAHLERRVRDLEAKLRRTKPRNAKPKAAAPRGR